jgi:amidase
MTGERASAHELLDRLAARELSARELTDGCLERLERAGSLNAVAAVDPDAVRAEADRADAARAAGDERPLLGLPVTIKDSLAVAGLTRRCGSYALEHDRPGEDATAVARLRAAGAVILAKTAVPEYMWSYETESAIQGRTVSPYDPARTPGGSSGGEAALIAAGVSPLGLGTDGGGSIRVPSHYCGIVGIRPSARLVPETGCWPVTRETGMIDMSTIGPMARSVDDVALALRLIAGEDGIDPFVGPAAVGDHRAVDVASLRVGFYAEDGVWPSTAATAAAVRAAAGALAAAGAEVSEVAPPPLEEATELFFAMMAADGGARARADLAAAGGRHVEQMTWLLDTLRESALSAEGYFDLVGRWSAFRARVRTFVAAHDVVVAPVTPGPAPLHGCRPGDDGPLETYLPWANVQAYSIAGLPGAVVPVLAERGLPLGVQIVAGAFRDHVALAAAAAVEEASGGYAAVSAPLLGVSA